MRGALVDEDQALREAKKPTCTEEEIVAYSWQKEADGKPNKEQPVKENDHGVDTTRYAVMYVDDGPAVQVVENPFYD
jgi:phage terminase large subunit